MNRLRICKNCVMDTTDTKIKFDSDGVCDHCNDFRERVMPRWKLGNQGFEELKLTAEKIKLEGKGKEFDCIIGMSGGVDSSYLVYVAKEMLGLRPLVFHVDAGWNSKEAVTNIENIVTGLGLDLYTDVVDWEEIKDLQLAYFKAGVSNIDVPQDLAFFAAMYRFSLKHKVKYILTGANISTECILPPTEWMWYADTRQLKDIHKKFGTVKLNKYKTMGILKRKVYLPYLRRVKVVKPLNYINYVKNNALKLLVDKFDYQVYPQKHFESVFTKFYEGFWLYEKFGYDTRKVQYSSLILTGQMTREEALENLKTLPYDPVTIKQDTLYIAEKLGITSDELMGYLRSPNRTYHDYKSSKFIFELGPKVMQFLGMKAEYRR